MAINIKIRDGDRVKLNKRAIDKLDWSILSDEYKEWVTANTNKVFTARLYREGKCGIFTLEEDTTNPKWIFLSYHLTKIKRRKLRNEG